MLHQLAGGLVGDTLADPVDAGLGHEFIRGLFRDAAGGHVGQGLLAELADGGAVVALHVLLGAEDEGNGLVDGGVIQEQHVLFFVADGTGGAVLEVDGAAEELEGRFLQHAGGVDAAGGLLPPVDGVVVHIQLAAGFQKIADVGLQRAVVAGQVDLAALVGGVAAQDQVRDLDLGPAFAPAAHVVEAGHAFGQALDLHQADQSALFGVDLGLDRGQALAFARERDAFDDGDMQRGRNQMLVIQGIVNKAASPAILKSYQDVLAAASDSIATNMPKEDIISLVKMQLQDMSGWNITTYGLAGENSADYCYSLGNDARYAVVRPNEQMVATAQDLIQQVLRGETPTVNP